eukprot:361839-Chlamydomonas_euryale.AAC.16
MQACGRARISWVGSQRIWQVGGRGRGDILLHHTVESNMQARVSACGRRRRLPVRQAVRATDRQGAYLRSRPFDRPCPASPRSKRQHPTKRPSRTRRTRGVCVPWHRRTASGYVAEVSSTALGRESGAEAEERSCGIRPLAPFVPHAQQEKLPGRSWTRLPTPTLDPRRQPGCKHNRIANVERGVDVAQQPQQQSGDGSDCQHSRHQRRADRLGRRCHLATQPVHRDR